MGVLSSFFPRAITSSYALVFDIGSAHVAASFVRYRPTHPAEVLFVHRSTIHYGEDPSADDLAYAVNDAIQKTARRMLDTIGKRTDVPSSRYALHAIVHAPWASSSSQRSERALQKETTVTKKLLQQFVDRNITPNTNPARTQFDGHITDVELNGYSTANPYKKTAKTLAVTYLSSTMATAVYDSLIDAFWQVFPEHTVQLHPFMYVALGLSGLFDNAESFTLIDIGGTYTSISTVEGRTVTNSAAAAFGTEHLIASVTKGDTDSRAAAASELTLFLKNTCTPSQCRKLEDLLKPAEQEWARAFGDACTEIAQTHKLPTRTFIAVSKDYFPWFERVIERFDFGQFTVTGRSLCAEQVSFNKTGSKVYFVTPSEYDLSLALGILFVEA